VDEVLFPATQSPKKEIAEIEEEEEEHLSHEDQV
jgi:hypothetical protein